MWGAARGLGADWEICVFGVVGLGMVSHQILLAPLGLWPGLECDGVQWDSGQGLECDGVQCLGEHLVGEKWASSWRGC